MRKSPLIIKVTSNGSTIGHMTTEEFRAYCGVQNAFLEDLVQRFNDGKARMGEPERVELILK